MLQVIAVMEARCVLYVKVCMFTQLEQNKISLMSVNKSEIVTLSVQHGIIVTVIFQ